MWMGNTSLRRRKGNNSTVKHVQIQRRVRGWNYARIPAAVVNDSELTTREGSRVGGPKTTTRYRYNGF